MALSGGFVERDVTSIRLPQWGRVVEAEGVVPWLVVDPDGEAVEPIQRFLRDFVARGNRPGSVRSYAYDLLRWWRWLAVVGVGWDKVTSAEVGDFVSVAGAGIEAAHLAEDGVGRHGRHRQRGDPQALSR